MIVGGRDHRPAAIADDGQRLRIELLHERVVAGHDRCDRGVEIFHLRPLEVLRLIALPGPAAGRCAVVLERAADAVVGAGARQQGVDLLDRGLRATGTKLQHATHWGREILVFEQLLDGLAVEARRFAALRLQPVFHLLDLVDRLDGAVGDLGQLGVDLGACGLCDLARGFGERPIDMEAARD